MMKLEIIMAKSLQWQCDGIIIKNNTLAHLTTDKIYLSLLLYLQLRQCWKYMSEQSSRSNCSIAECFPGNLSW